MVKDTVLFTFYLVFRYYTDYSMYNEPPAIGEQLHNAVKNYWNKDNQVMDPKDQVAAEEANDINIATDSADVAEQNRGQGELAADASASSSDSVDIGEIAQNDAAQENVVDWSWIPFFIIDKENISKVYPKKSFIHEALKKKETKKKELTEFKTWHSLAICSLILYDPQRVSWFIHYKTWKLCEKTMNLWIGDKCVSSEQSNVGGYVLSWTQFYGN